jgi:hypothetical protein
MTKSMWWSILITATHLKPTSLARVTFPKNKPYIVANNECASSYNVKLLWRIPKDMRQVMHSVALSDWHSTPSQKTREGLILLQ